MKFLLFIALSNIILVTTSKAGLLASGKASSYITQQIIPGNSLANIPLGYSTIIPQHINEAITLAPSLTSRQFYPQQILFPSYTAQAIRQQYYPGYPGYPGYPTFIGQYPGYPVQQPIFIGIPGAGYPGLIPTNPVQAPGAGTGIPPGATVDGDTVSVEAARTSSNSGKSNDNISVKSSVAKSLTDTESPSSTTTTTPTPSSSSTAEDSELSTSNSHHDEDATSTTSSTTESSSTTTASSSSTTTTTSSKDTSSQSTITPAATLRLSNIQPTTFSFPSFGLQPLSLEPISPNAERTFYGNPAIFSRFNLQQF